MSGILPPAKPQIWLTLQLACTLVGSRSHQVPNIELVWCNIVSSVGLQVSALLHRNIFTTKLQFRRFYYEARLVLWDVSSETPPELILKLVASSWWDMLLMASWHIEATTECKCEKETNSLTWLQKPNPGHSPGKRQHFFCTRPAPLGLDLTGLACCCLSVAQKTELQY